MKGCGEKAKPSEIAGVSLQWEQNGDDEETLGVPVFGHCLDV
jgi:hypothetical protein